MKELIRALSPHAWAAVAIGAVSAFAIVIFVILPWGQSRFNAGFAAADAARERANSEALKIDGSARETAADERLNDARSTSTLTETLINAVAPLPDARPSDRRRALACARLRADPRVDQAAVAAQCGPAG